MDYELKHIDAWSIAKTVFVIFLILGFLFGLFYILLLAGLSNIAGNFGGEFGSDIPHVGGPLLLLLSIFIAVFVAVLYAVVGAIFAVLYNIFMGWIGGIKVELEPEENHSSSKEEIVE